MTCRTRALFAMMIKLILAILEVLCYCPNDLWVSSPQRGLETQSWSLLPKAAKPSIWQKPWALVHPNHRPPTKVVMGWSPTLRVFLLFQRDIYTLLMWSSQCTCLTHTADYRTNCCVTVFYRQQRLRRRNMQINTWSAQGLGRRCQRTVPSLGRLTITGRRS